jgi:hypothetical protein
MAQEIQLKLRFGRNIISTVNIDTGIVSKNGKKRIGDFVYIPILELKPEFFYSYAYENHRKGRAGQTTIIIDEAQIIFNPREFQRKERADWILFFTKHRHLGYNIIMISQFDRLIDRQIRCLFEYEVKHRKVNNYGILFLLPWTFFIAIEYWYGNKMVISRRFIRYKKKTAAIYDSYVMFDDFLAEMVGEKPETNNDIDGCVTDTASNDPEMTMNCVKEEDDEACERSMDITPPAVDTQLGAGGPQRSGGTRWWLTGLMNARIKGWEKAV